MSLRVVVFPEPLRPSRTRVSARCTSRFRSCSSSRPESPSPFTRYATWRNSMAGLVSEESFIECFVHPPSRTRVPAACSEGRMPSGTAGKMPALCNFVCRLRQAGDTNARMAFVPDVQADQQGCDLLQDARVLQFAAIEGADSGNLCGQDAHDLAGV